MFTVFELAVATKRKVNLEPINLTLKDMQNKIITYITVIFLIKAFYL